jgi:PAS domain S-box-containing protein
MTPLHHAPPAVGELLDILPEAVVVVDARGLILYANPAVRALLGYAPSELLDKPLSLLVPPSVRERHEAMVARFRHQGRPMLMGDRPVLHALHRSGRPVALSISLCNLTIEGGQRVSVAVMHDVSTLQTRLDRATHAAETDTLTGAANRLALSRRMQALLAAGRAFALLYLDLTGFKPLNDRWVTRPATRRWASSASGCRPTFVEPTWWHAWAATSSSC